MRADSAFGPQFFNDIDEPLVQFFILHNSDWNAKLLGAAKYGQTTTSGTPDRATPR